MMFHEAPNAQTHIISNKPKWRNKTIKEVSREEIMSLIMHSTH